MDDTAPVQVLDGLADEAGNGKGVFLRKRATAVEQIAERATPEVLGHDVRPAFVFDRQEPQDERVVEIATDLLFPLEAGKEVGVRFVFQMRHLYGDRLAVV